MIIDRLDIEKAQRSLETAFVQPNIFQGTL